MTRWMAAWPLLLGQIVADPTAARTFSSRNRTPKSVFWVVMALLAVGIGRKLMQWYCARNAVVNLEGDRPDLGAIAESAKHGRSGLVELFRLLTSGKDEAVRRAAGHALSILWKQDEMIAEEEKALVTRGFDVVWKARRRYPRALDRPIAIVAEFGVPFLAEEGGGVGPSSLEWSARILGSDRASLEKFGEWSAGSGRIAFEVDPRDLATNGPHRRALHVKARVVGLTSTWELDLPQVPFTFEMDSNLAPEALLGSPDEGRAAIVESALRLEVVATDAGDFFPLNALFAIRGRILIRVAETLPADLAHHIVVEIEGVAAGIDAGGLVALRDRPAREVEVKSEEGLVGDALTSPGERRIRLILSPDVHRGWCDPDVRSIWPGRIVTPWVSVGIVRR